MSSRQAYIGAAARWAFLAAVIALAAFLRFDGLGRPSYWLDEILGQQLTTSAAGAPLWQWVTGLEPEHGPLYYATQLATRLAGRDEAAGRLAAALFGLATIPLVWLAGLLLPGTGGAHSSSPAPPSKAADTPLRDPARYWPAAVAAILLAISPLHVYYSREARPYALVIFLTTLLVIVLLRGRSIVATGVVLVALLYTSAVALPVVAAAAVTAGVAGWLSKDDADRKRLLAIAAIASAVTVLFVALYRGSPSSHEAAAFPTSAAAVLMEICRALTVSALGADEHGRATVAMVVLAIAGAVVLARRHRVTATVVIGMTVLPALFAVLSLRLLGHWFAIRYVAPAIGGFVLLTACGIASAGELASIPFRRWRGAAAIAVSLAITAGIATQTWAASRREPFEKVDWRAIAAALERRMRAGDALVFADPWSDVCVRHYLRADPAGVRMALTSPHMSQILTMTHPSVWFVSDGAASTALRSWACRFPAVLTTRLESVRINYAPTKGRYIQTRSAPEDLRAAAAALGEHGFAVRIGAGDDVLLGDGWGATEGAAGDEYRWVIGREASIGVPLFGRHDRIVRVHATPSAHASLPQQRIAIFVNTRKIAEEALPNEGRDYALEVPAAAWIDGLNTIAFRFSRATEPASLDPRSTDHRPLAASFDLFSIEDKGAPIGRTKAPIVTAAFASADLLAARGAERSDRTRFPPTHLNRTNVETLLGRLGVDPQDAWPRLQYDQLHVEDVAETIAYGSGCEDDRAFLERAFALMVQRRPNSVEERDLLDRLRRGATRAQIIHRIANADDFRASMLIR